MEQHASVITIDGPSGVGKGTVSRLLAQKLKWNLLDSGALYRVLALAAYQHDLPLDEESALEVLAAHLDVQFTTDSADYGVQVILEGGNVTDLIRTEKTGNAASQVSRFPKVRQALLDRQKAFRQQPGLIAEGRDMGTVVFPDAELKIFLTASTEVRAERRYKQLKEKGASVTMPTVLAELAERDERDQSRQVAPLKPADDAILIDTSSLSVNDVLTRVFHTIQTSGIISLA